MYGRKAYQLVKELASCESGQLSAYNIDLFEQVIRECSTHHAELQTLIRKIQDDGLDTQATRKPDHCGALIHHLALVRNKRCLMTYMNNRADIVRSLRWKVGPVLPQEILVKLNFSETEYFKNHSAAMDSYMSEVELDLTVIFAVILFDSLLEQVPYPPLDGSLIQDFVPPKDPYIQVRVLDDTGEVLPSDKSATLAPHSIHFLKGTDAEPFIAQGLMEELIN